MLFCFTAAFADYKDEDGKETTVDVVARSTAISDQWVWTFVSRWRDFVVTKTLSRHLHRLGQPHDAGSIIVSQFAEMSQI